MREDVPFVKGIGKNPCFSPIFIHPQHAGRPLPASFRAKRPEARDGAVGGGGVALRLPICTEPELVPSQAERPRPPFLSLRQRQPRCQVGRRRQAGRPAADL